MYELKLDGVPLPRCMVCEKRSEAELAREQGWPYVIKPAGWNDRKLAGAILYRMLKDKFPYIKWDQLLGLRKAQVNRIIVNVPTEEIERVTTRTPVKQGALESMDGMCDKTTVTDDYIYGTDEEYIEEAEPIQEYQQVNMDEFFADAVDYVNMENLKQLGLLPQFMADIVDSIKLNLVGTSWMDGYNKKLGTTVGDYKYGKEAGNLIILDVSGSIPYGLSHTMVTIIDMLRTQANADLIITGSQSNWFSKDEDMPRPEQLAILIGGCNEASEFNHILEDKIFGRHWGNVICFGDMHAPTDSRFRSDYQVHDDRRRNTEINRVLCYDTRGKKVPGYVLWAMPHAQQVDFDDGSWCNYFKRE